MIVKSGLLCLSTSFRSIFILAMLCIPSVIAGSEHRYQQNSHNKSQNKNNRHKYITAVSNWGTWKPWSPCSRTCGDGITEQTRDCVANIRHRHRHQKEDKTKSGNCVGLYKRFKVCNLEPCPAGSEDFRTAQCTSYNSKSFMGRHYEWEPFLQAPNKCELNCRAIGHRFYAKLSEKVIDGTQCEPGSIDICVNGVCETLGCDGVIGSNKKLDHCGICGGDNSTCKIVSGVFTQPHLPAGYNTIAQIPKGACNINITELKDSRNYLALKSTYSGLYVINGNWAIDLSGNYDAAGTTFIYHRPTGSEGEIIHECITAKGPTKENLDIELIYQQPNPGIKYEYTIPVQDAPILPPPSGVDITKTPLAPSLANSHVNDAMAGGPDRPSGRSSYYTWKVTGLTPCSKTCGGGVQKTIVACVKDNTLARVADSNCDSISKPPPQTVQCNNRPCPPGRIKGKAPSGTNSGGSNKVIASSPIRWEWGNWSDCSVSCGDGIQTREITCMQELTATMKIKISPSSCGPKPVDLTTRICKNKPCTDWKIDEWSQCSVECGKGMMDRLVICVNSDRVTVPDSECQEPKPKSQEMCDLGSCTPTWYFSEWSEHCSEDCNGHQNRKIFCGRGSGINESTCDSTKKPNVQKTCKGEKTCHGKWFSGPWTHCTSTCGNGTQTREIVCVSHSRGQFRRALDINCHDSKKPISERECHDKPCEPEWYLTEWGECTKSCDTGVQNRDVKCVDQDMKSSMKCNESTKPPIRQACNTQACPEYNRDASCVDKLSTCRLAVQARLCSYSYYKRACCNSCHGYR